MIAWEEWRPKPARTRHVQFTGFGPSGNGFELLADLEQRGVHAVGDGDLLHIDTRERADAIAHAGDWLVIGTRGEVYPVSPEVHADKYERVQP